jgi:hypothetical protein
MHQDHRPAAQGNQARLLLSWHEMELAKVQYRIAVLESYLKVGPLEREALERVFREDTGEDLLKSETPKS